jgi:predicted nicotinamide N-methyase
VGAVDPVEFVCAHTALGVPPYLPELRLHLATDAFALWERTEEDLGGGVVSAPPFWAFPWAGGQALARHLLDHPELVRDRTVLDLAAGSGLVAIAAAKCGAVGVTANEIDPYAGAAITLNAAANDVAIAVRLCDLLDGPASAEVVLAGDVFYSRDMAERVLAFLERARGSGARVLVGDPGRAYLPRGQLTEVASYQVPVVRALEDAQVKLATVWRLS